MMAIKTDQMRELFNEGYSMVDLLPYVEYSDGIFVQSDGSLGKIWQVETLEAEGKTADYLASLSSHVQNFLSRLPSHQIACQMILISSRDVSQQLNAYSHWQESAKGTMAFKEGKIDHIRSSRKGLFSHNGQVFIPRGIRVFIAMRFFPQWVHPNFLDKVQLSFKAVPDINDRFQEQAQAQREVFAKHTALLDGIFQGAGIKHVCVDGQGLGTLLYPLLNPRRAAATPIVDIHDQEDLREQVLFNAPEATGDGFIFEGIPTRMVTLKELPGTTQPGIFSKELYEATRFCLLDAAPDLMMAINFTVPSLQEAMSRLKMQKSFAFMHKDNWLGDKSIEAVEKKEELDGLIGQMFKGNEKIVHARIHFIVWGEDQAQCDVWADQIINILGRLGCEGFKEEMIGASLFLTCLPLNFDPYYEQFIKRVKKITSPNAADMMPLLGSFQGTKTPAQMYFNRRGEIIFLDFFDSNINPHGVVIGASGAGKSFFMNDFIVQNERLGAHFFVLDKGDSYKKLCSILGGQYMAFDINHPVTINPFIHEPTPENLSFLMSLLSQMASGGDDRDRLNREEEGLIQRAVIKAYEIKKIKEVEITLSDVVAILNENQFNDQFGINSVMGPTLALRLTPFTNKGPYGGFFDGPNQFQIAGRFTVFELANLSAYTDLQLVVLLNLMFFMTNFVAQARMRPLRKYLLIDEAWSLLKVKNTADFITNAFKTFRKYRCSVVAITQEMADLTRQESGIAIVANASNKIFLKQEAALIDLLKDKLSLDDAVITALKTVETVKGKFSESLVITDSASGVVRLIPDPFLYWAANSEARNNDYLIKKMNETGLGIIEALKLCAKEYPYGIQ